MSTRPIPPRTSDDKCRPQADPVNIIVRLHDASEVNGHLVSRGWVQPNWLHGYLPASSQFICTPDPRRQAHHVVRGSRNSIRRLHARIWDFEDDVVASAHDELLSLRGWHDVASFEGGKAAVVDDLRLLGHAATMDAIALESPRAVPYASGFAAEIA